VDECRSVLSDSGFPTTTVWVDSDERSGAFLGTSPPRGGRVIQGQVVSILVSNGSDYAEPTPVPRAPRPTPTPEQTPTPQPTPTGPPVSPGTSDPPGTADRESHGGGPPGSPGSTPRTGG
jgi:beta-lactam-binding protein with PASTA domain